MATAPAKRIRLSIDLPLTAQRRIHKAATKRSLSVRQYISEAVQQRLKEDFPEEDQQGSLLVLNAQTDPVLAELWDNAQDAASDRL